MLTDSQKVEFYNYCIKTGFIILSAEDWPEDKKLLKLQKFIAQGYRIRDYGEDFEVININGIIISDNRRKVIEDLYNWLIS